MRGKCDGRLQNWPGIANERPKFLAMACDTGYTFTCICYAQSMDLRKPWIVLRKPGMAGSICMVCLRNLEIAFIYIWDSFRQNEPSYKYIKSYKIPLRLNSYNFPTVKAIDILFSALHTIPFLYGKIHFGIFHLLSTSIATFDTPLGSNPP